MSPEKQRAIARKGGQAAHSKGTAHEFSSEEARSAGRVGGKAVSANRAHMADIGRKGGQRSVHRGSTAAARKRSYSASSLGAERSIPQGNITLSVTDRLRADHRRINGLFHQYEFGGQAASARATLLKQICHELLRHTALEEDRVYPVVRRAFAASEQQQLDASVRVHERMRELIRHIEERELEEDSVMMLVRDLQTCVQQHVREEEQEVLPKAEERLGPELQQLGYELSLERQNENPPPGAEQRNALAPQEADSVEGHVNALPSALELPEAMPSVETERSEPAKDE